MAGTEGPPAERAKKRARLGDAVSGGDAASLAEGVEDLPVYKCRAEILDAVRRHPVIVLVGETGSGKTTQVPKFLHQAGHGGKGSVVCTQPRRIAAVSVAARVASEMGCQVGGLVGYHVRFDNRTTAETKLKYMTDGMLVRESCGEWGLKRCGVVILDEAHERSIHTDILFGLVKVAIDEGQPLRVVVMSATLSTARIVDFFGGPKHVKVLFVPGRQFEVKMYYTPIPEPDYLEAALITVLQLHATRPLGDVLVFLPGQDDIDGLGRLLEEKRAILAEKRRQGPKQPLFAGLEESLEQSLTLKAELPAAGAVGDFIVRPIFAALPFDQQQQVFEPPPPGIRKIVLATNIAETSITIPGIRFVVDTGVMKLKICHPQTGVEILRLVETSQASARQRSGRAGREAPGEAYRLYVESELNKMPSQTPAEILRCEMASVYLQLKALGIKKISSFPLVDRPPVEALVKAAHFLARVGALDKEDDLTEVGRKLAMMPIHPLYAYCLLVSVEFECIAEMLSIVAMLSADAPVFVSAPGKRELSAESKSLLVEDGDHLTLLNVFSKWSKAQHRRSFAQQHALSNAGLERALSIREQLKDLMKTAWGVKNITSAGGPKNWQVVRRSLLKACFTQTARRDEVNQNVYTTMLTRQQAKLHPTSVLFRRRPPPPCVVYAELVTTTRSYLRTATEVDPAWLPELCPRYFAAAGGALVAVGG